MKSTWFPPHVIRVGLESNQHGQAALQEHASSSWPVIFHFVTSFGALKTGGIVTAAASNARKAVFMQKF
jgi:hypothetical protein